MSVTRLWSVALLAVGLFGCTDEDKDSGATEAPGTFTVHGSLGGDGSVTWLVEAVPWDHWTGEVDDNTGYQSVETTGPWSFTLEEGDWALAAAQGTCFGVEKVTGTAGQDIEMSIDMDCSE
jgi:hypothetical protein